MFLIQLALRTSPTQILRALIGRINPRYIEGYKTLKNNHFLQQFASLYEKARKGVVIFSLGSLVDPTKMPAKMKSDILLAFSQFPDYDFIVKLTVSEEEREKFSSYKNIHFFDWIEQVNLLSKFENLIKIC